MKQTTFLTLLLLLAVSTGVKAEEQGVALQLGYANPVLREPDLTAENLSYNSKLKNPTQLRGFKFGVAYEGTIAKGFGAFFALDYTAGFNNTKWQQKTPNMKDPRVSTRTQYHDLSLRSDWQYKFNVAKQTYLLLYTGPVIDINLAMKSNYREKNFDLMKREDVITVNETKNRMDDLLRYNIQWGIGAGFQYDRYYLRGGYDFGIVNTYKHKTYDNEFGTHKYRSRLDAWHITLGVFLWRSEE